MSLDRLTGRKERMVHVCRAARFSAVLTIAALLCSPLSGQTGATPSRTGNDAQDNGASETGVLEGIVVYQSDSNRPWRYQRYYVKDRKLGLLAEAVVAISGAKLKDSAPGRPPQSVTMDQKDHRFVPETIVIAAGDKVKFTNSDSFVHNVYSSTPLQVFDATMGSGGEHVQEFGRASGIRRPVEIGCKLHSQMKAWIFVFDHPFFALTGEDGRFRLENVPPGEYDLQLHHPSGQLRARQQVEVRAGETQRVEIRVSPDNRAT